VRTVPSRHGRPAAGTTSNAKTDFDIKADEIARTIGGVRERLWNNDLFLMHPRVVQEVRAFIEQIDIYVSRTNSPRGRHHLPDPAALARSKPTKSDLEPNPLAATTPAEFVEVLRHYREWNGNPSWRNMAIRAHQLVSHSTMQKAVSTDSLPKFVVVEAIVRGCDGSDDDLKEFNLAYQRIEKQSAYRVLTDRVN
jgi:hypothetical protein